MGALLELVGGADRHPGPCIISTGYRDTADYIVDQLQLAELGGAVDSIVADRSPRENEEVVRRISSENGTLVATTAACQGFEFGRAGLSFIMTPRETLRV